ncbi:MAG: N-acetylmuramoyl-L-alanine amidase [Bdellovibrionota bacterium]
MKLITIAILILAYCPMAAAKLRTVVIDPAAGGTYTGVQTRLFYEKDASLLIAQKIKALLKNKRIQTTLTRFDDYPLTPAERISIANQEKEAVWLSVHLGQALGASHIDIYTLDTLPSKRRETNFLIPIEKAHQPWISRSILFANTLQETMPPALQPSHIHSDLAIASLLGVNHPAVMIEINLDTQTMQPAVFQNLLDELSERISIAVATFIKKERKL